MGYLEILSKVVDGIKWAFSHPRLALELALVVALLLVGWRYNKKQAELAKVQAEAGVLEDGLKLQISVVNGQLEVLRKKLDGTTSVEHVYVPPEGSVVIKQKELDTLKSKLQWLMNALGNATTAEEREKLQDEIRKLREQLGNTDTIVTVKDKGFTVKPGFGLEWAGYGISPRLDLKLYYYKRYSLLFGGGRDGLDVSVSRHLDDILFWHPQNVELFAGYLFLPIGHDVQRLPVVGLRSNF